MSNLPDGGIYAHYEVLPLHEASQVALPVINDLEKNDEEFFISFDIFYDSFLYGNFNGWNKATQILTKNVNTNGDSRLKRLERGMPSLKTVSLVALLDSNASGVMHAFQR